MEVRHIAEESPELNRIWESYKEHQRELQEKLDFVRAEMRRLGALYEECRKLWMEGDFKRLSEALDKEGFPYFRELSKKLQGLSNEEDRVLQDLDRINRDLKEGTVCPRCDGIGRIILEKRYERSEGQIVPIVRMQECSLCKGSGKLRPPRPM